MEWKFIFDKLTSWPVLAFVLISIALIWLRKPIKTLITKANQVKVGNLELTVNEIGRALGISNVIKEINDLGYDELKIFLIICGEDSDYYVFAPNNLPPERMKEIYTKFSNKGLIEIIDPTKIEGYEKLKERHGNAQYGYKTTTKGKTIYKAILETIFHELTETKLKK